MIFQCFVCREDFTATYWQKKRHAKGRKNFACSLSCRGRNASKMRTLRNGRDVLTEAQMARKKVYLATKQGIITRAENCERCGKFYPRTQRGAIHAHHFMGYAHPLKVEWLCAACHKAADASSVPRGENHARAKLNDIAVRDIRTRLRHGESGREIAKFYGVDKQIVYRIRDGIIWGHVQ